MIPMTGRLEFAPIMVRIVFYLQETQAKQAEDDMIDTGEDLSADVYKASHHGSKTGSSDDFLDKVSPAYAVISCGEGNKYGHPSAQTLNNFRSRGIKTFRTDNQGTIVAYSDGSDITWNASPDTTWTPGEPKRFFF